MARSERKRLGRRSALIMGASFLLPLLVACNAIIGLSDFEKAECAGRRCADAAVPPPNEGGLDVISDAPPEVRGANPVSWAQWPMPNSDGGGDLLPNPMKYDPVGTDRLKDTVTGLVWRNATLPARPYEAAKSACAALDPLTGPWRLPKRIELVTLLDFGRAPNRIDPLFTGVTNGQVWTSSESRKLDVTRSPPVPVPTDAFWTVDFSTGVVDVLSTAGGADAKVLCVQAK